MSDGRYACLPIRGRQPAVGGAASDLLLQQRVLVAEAAKWLRFLIDSHLLLFFHE